MAEAIVRFRGDHAFLSNFAPARVVLDGIEFPSVEHAYQAAKTLDVAWRQRIAGGTAAEAKRLGRSVPMRDGWNEMRLGVMFALLQQKFAAGTAHGAALLATGDAELIEENTWGDRYWGVCAGAGQNHLGRLLTLWRSHLRGDRKRA